MKYSQSAKVFLVFGMLTAYLTTLKEPERSKAKAWFKKFITIGNSLWRELQGNQKKIDKELPNTQQELEEYLMYVVNTALDIPVDKYNEFIKLITKFKDKYNNK